MKLDSIRLSGFRNIDCQTVDFKSSVNVLIGENGQGKTNLLEAIYMFACGKSFRVPHFRETVGHEENKAQVKISVSGEGLPFELEMVLDKKAGKSVFRNGCRIEKLSRFLGQFRAVLFCPEHLSLIKAGPRVRRSFLDGAICQLRPYYASLLNEFLRVEAQRSAVLKQMANHRSLQDTLSVWDEKLSEAAGKICFLRNEYIGELQRFAPEEYARISNGREKLEIFYQSDVYQKGKSAEEMAADYRLLLKATLAADVKYGVTQKGPQRDDLDFRMNGYSARQFSSQGQQRSAVLALKLAEGEISKRQTGQEPCFLLDDVLSELDENRRRFITEGLSGKQVILTGTDEEDFPFSAHRIYVQNGRYSCAKRFS